VLYCEDSRSVEVACFVWRLVLARGHMRFSSGEKGLAPKFDNKGKRGLRESTCGSLWDLHKEIKGLCALREDPTGIRELIQLLRE
jgi:hypothetical protein